MQQHALLDQYLPASCSTQATYEFRAPNSDSPPARLSAWPLQTSSSPAAKPSPAVPHVGGRPVHEALQAHDLGGHAAAERVGRQRPGAPKARRARPGRRPRLDRAQAPTRRLRQVAVRAVAPPPAHSSSYRLQQAALRHVQYSVWPPLECRTVPELRAHCLRPSPHPPFAAACSPRPWAEGARSRPCGAERWAEHPTAYWAQRQQLRILERRFLHEAQDALCQCCSIGGCHHVSSRC